LQALRKEQIAHYSTIIIKLKIQRLERKIEGKRLISEGDLKEAHLNADLIMPGVVMCFVEVQADV